MFKYIINLFMIISLFGSGHSSSLEPQHSSNPWKKPVLVFDNLQNNSLVNPDIEVNIPKRYRNGYNLSPKLYASASAQPNFADLHYIITNAKKLAKISEKKIFIVDLRQEPHAMLNENAISWYGFRNKVKHELEPILIKDLHEQKVVKVYTGINKLPDGHFIPKSHIAVKINQIITEQAMIENLGANYFRLLIQDHFAPEDPQIDLFVNFLKKIPKNAWIHFHCRGGRGRSTTLMAMLDMVKHKGQLSFEDILIRQQQIGGIILSNLQFDENYKKWKEPAATARYNFIKKFYDYVSDPQGYQTTNWSDWIQKTVDQMEK